MQWYSSSFSTCHLAFFLFLFSFFFLWLSPSCFPHCSNVDLEGLQELPKRVFSGSAPLHGGAVKHFSNPAEDLG